MSDELYELIQKTTIRFKLDKLEKEVEEKIEFINDYTNALESVYDEEEIKNDNDIQINLIEHMENIYELKTRLHYVTQQVYTMKKASKEIYEMYTDGRLLMSYLDHLMDKLRKYTL